MGNPCSTCLHILGLGGPAHGKRLNATRGRNGGVAVAYDAAVGTKPGDTSRPAPQPTGNKKALLVGINYVGTQAELKGCHNDVHRMTGVLKEMYGFRDDSIQILLDHGNYAQPTREAILQACDWLVKGARPGDVFFFHFSGHGAQQEDPRGGEEDGMDETICPVDFQQSGQIIDDELYEALCARLPNGAKLTAVMDCCHSGTGLDLPFANQGAHWVEDDNPVHCEADVQMFSGCDDDQCSADVQGLYNKPCGAMTSAFCDSLTRNPTASYDALLRAMHSHLSSNGHSQLPQLTSSQRFDAARVPFQVCDGIQPNTNPVIGRQFNKRKHPKRQAFYDNNPLDGMLMNMMITDMMFDSMMYGGMGGGMFGDPYGGGMFGDPYGGGDMYGGGGDMFGGGDEGWGGGDFGGGDDW